ncbi:MAG: helix-turn-helix domain-containing protein [Lentisphaerae bacterium]|nr:helix-turn-helix domain-containing protein [Lentisphaerota bacterium]
MFKKKFAQKLRELQKRSGVRQKDLAVKLGMSDALVSQFMHGVALPRMEQFRMMLEIMDVPADEAGRLRFQLMMARAGSQDEPSTPVQPDPDVSILMPETPCDISGEQNHWKNLCNDYFLAEAPEQKKSGIPVIMLNDMNVFDHSIPLETYARHRTTNMASISSPLPGTVLILADGASLALPHCGTLRLLVTDKLPEGTSSLELYGFNDNTFRIIPSRKNDSAHWDSFFPSQQFEADQVRWKLPLLEMGITPVHEFTNKKQKNKRSR